MGSIRMNKVEKAFFAKSFDVIVPLGPACMVASALKRSGWRFCSLPFDWVGGGSMLRRCEYMANGFTDWMVREYMEYLHDMDGMFEKERAFRNIKTDFYYVHDFRDKADFDANFERVKTKYARRIARYQALCKNSRRILFMWMDSDFTLSPEPDGDEELKQALDVLQSTYPHAEISLLYIREEQGLNLGNRISESPAQGILRTRFEFKIPGRQIRDEVHRKVLRKFFKKIKFSRLHLSWSEYFAYCRKRFF